MHICVAVVNKSDTSQLYRLDFHHCRAGSASYGIAHDSTKGEVRQRLVLHCTVTSTCVTPELSQRGNKRKRNACLNERTSLHEKVQRALELGYSCAVFSELQCTCSTVRHVFNAERCSCLAAICVPQRRKAHNIPIAS